MCDQRTRDYIEGQILGYLLDPPVNAYHCGYLVALLKVHQEALCLPPCPETIAAERLLSTVASASTAARTREA